MTDWTRFVDRFGPAIWRRAYRLLGNEADAADCYQTVLLEAFQTLELADRPDHDWSPLLARMTSCRAIDRLRVRGRQRTAALPETGVGNAAAGRDTDAVDDRDLADHLRVAIARLPDDQAEAFTLRYVDGLENAEVAAATGRTPNHVAVLLHRARSTLRARLEPRSDRE